MKYGKLLIIPPIDGRALAHTTALFFATAHQAGKTADATATGVKDREQIFPHVANKDTFYPRG